jgi:hypothetical protein
MTIFRMVLTLMFQGVFPCISIFGGSGAVQGQALANEKAASVAAGQYGAQAGDESAQLNPLFMQDIRATHGYTPGQTNEMLTAAGQGAGGAFGGAEGQINANAARTGNATSVTKSLDEMARDKAKSAAGTSEGVAAADVNAAKALNAQGAAGMQGLYGTNVNAQLGAMKQQNADVQTENQVQAPSLMSDLQSINSLVPKMPGM